MQALPLLHMDSMVLYWRREWSVALYHLNLTLMKRSKPICITFSFSVVITRVSLPSTIEYHKMKITLFKSGYFHNIRIMIHSQNGDTYENTHNCKKDVIYHPCYQRVLVFQNDCGVQTKSPNRWYSNNPDDLLICERVLKDSCMVLRKSFIL